VDFDETWAQQIKDKVNSNGLLDTYWYTDHVEITDYDKDACSGCASAHCINSEDGNEADTNIDFNVDEDGDVSDVSVSTLQPYHDFMFD
jgi:hypothetical protein